MAGNEALEREIARLLDQGDLTAATTAALRGYGPELLGFLVAIARDEADGLEAFSMLSEDLWRGLAGFERASSFRTWAYILARHALARLRRDPHRRRRRTLAPAHVARLVEEVHETTAPHLRTSIKDRFAGLRASLTVDEQTLLILRVDRGLSWGEVAEILSDPARPVSQQTLWKRYERVKAKLRRLAAEAGLASR